MRVYEGLETLPESFSASTVAVGTFDGVHVGHHEIIRHAIADAKAGGRKSVVFTFDRHPAELLAPDRVPGYLTTPSQKIRWLSALKPDALLIARFDRDFSELSPETFLKGILKERLGAAAIVVGTNFLFGKARAGDREYLAENQSRFDYTLHALEPILLDDAPASSTRIRECLRAGEIAEAEGMLGHPFLLAGTVVKGQQLGRKLGYPTANLSLEVAQVVPLDGIYAVEAYLQDGRKFGGACSIGNRPTIEKAGRSIETYLFDFDEDIYETTMEVRFVRRLRAEAKFESLEALITQIDEDVRQAKEILTRQD